MKPGIYTDLSNADYHSGPGISKSGLDIIDRSPAHFHHARQNPRHESTAAQALGSAFHMLVLEPHLFVKSYCLALRHQDAPAGTVFSRDDLVAKVKELADRLGKKLATSGTKAQLSEILCSNGVPVVLWEDVQEEWKANNYGRTVLDKDTWETVHAMAAACMDHPAAAALLTSKPGQAEVSIYWVDKETGELCRIRPDFLRNDNVIVDLKSTDDASPAGFAHSISKWRYHVQDAFYSDGLEAATGRQARAFAFIAVEKKAPFAVAVYVLDAPSRDIGRAKYRENLRTLASCKQSGQWPAYGDTIQPISLPQWEIVRNAHLVTSE